MDIMDEKVDVYICKRCCEEWFDAEITECPFCKYKNFVHTSYIRNSEKPFEHYEHEDYKAYKRLFNSLQIQPEFDPKIRDELIDSRQRESMLQAIAHAFSNSANAPKCPTCGSTNVHPISTTKKATGFFFFGIFSGAFGKSFECGNCKYKW